MNSEEAIRDLKAIINRLENGMPCHAIADIHDFASKIPIEGIEGWGITPRLRCSHCPLNPCTLDEIAKKKCTQEAYN